jgi:hypothetical protein
MCGSRRKHETERVKEEESANFPPHARHEIWSGRIIANQLSQWQLVEIDFWQA